MGGFGYLLIIPIFNINFASFEGHHIILGIIRPLLFRSSWHEEKEALMVIGVVPNDHFDATVKIGMV